MAQSAPSFLGHTSGSGVGTNAGVTVTLAAVAGQAYSARSIQVSGDAAAVVTIESPSGTVLWKLRFAAAFNYTSPEWVNDEIRGADGAAMLLKISASTSNCEANIQAAKLQGAK